MTTRYILAKLISTEVSDGDDRGVAGLYEMDVEEDAEYPVAACLDAFHESVAVEVLDDFEFVVLDPEGNELAEEEGAESYQNGADAVMLEMIPYEEAPAALRRNIFEAASVAYICTYSIQGEKLHFSGRTPAEFHALADSDIGEGAMEDPARYGAEIHSCLMVMGDGGIMTGYPRRPR